ncbi:MAG: hypothetical protein ACPGYV_12930, partial [Phycisphaeraceae bacterium]
GKTLIKRDLSGKPRSINSGLLSLLLEQGYSPVLTIPIVDENGFAINSENDDIVARIAEIPRRERGQVWVTSVSTSYTPARPMIDDGLGNLVPADPGVSGGGGFSGGGFAATSGTAAGLTPIPFPTPAAQPPTPTPAPDGTEPEADDDGPPTAEELEDSPAPRIVVTINGKTTMDGASISQLLRREFVGWMQDNIERPDRPYLLIPAIKDFSQLSSTATRTGPTATGQNASGLSPKPTKKAGTTSGGSTIPGPGFSQPGDFGEPGGTRTEKEQIEVKTPEGWYASLSANSAGFTADALTPRRPLSAEDASGDYRFTFKFEVILLPPDEARKSILPSEPSDDDANDSAGPTASTLNQEDQS